MASSVSTHCVYRTPKGERCKRVVKSNKYVLDGSIVRYYCHAHEKYAVGDKVDPDFDVSGLYNHGLIEDPMDLDQPRDVITKPPKRKYESIITKPPKRNYEDDEDVIIKPPKREYEQEEYEEIFVMVKVKRRKIQ